MIFLSYFHEHVYFIKGKEEFKLEGEDLEKLYNFEIFLKTLNN